jgi:bifunctional DNA-binding transcriptional regulator/antitoxin component of YhaV-PrlF toxin-antitoxin module
VGARPGMHSSHRGVRLVTTVRYNAEMPIASNAKVSHRGQTSVPAELRRRWGIEAGGELAFIDLGGAALIVPGGLDAARAELRRVLSDHYEAGLATIADPDLLDQ